MKKGIIASLAVVWLTIASVCAIVTVEQYDIMAPAVASSDAETMDSTPAVEGAEASEDWNVTKPEDTIVPQDETKTASKENNSVVDETAPKQQTGQKIDVKKTMEAYENILAAWFEKDVAESNTEPASSKTDNTKTVATLTQLDDAKGTLSVKDKLEAAKLLSKVDMNDIKTMISMAEGGVTLKEARDMDKILKNHLSAEEVKKLEALAKSYVK